MNPFFYGLILGILLGGSFAAVVTIIITARLNGSLEEW